MADLDLTATRRVLADIEVERQRQHAKWGEQNLPDDTGEDGDALAARYAREQVNRAMSRGSHTWRMILREEVAEAFAERVPERLRAELVQVAAVVCQWIEAIDRRAGRH